jgi:zinc protease
MIRSIVIFLLILCSSISIYAQDKIKLIERSEKITEYRLDNGMRLLLVPDKSAPVVTVMILYHVGSRNEAVGHTGATHLLEHMMFKGTPGFNKEKGTQIAAMLESVGADYNASTWYDRTNYYATLPSDKLELALQIEADRMRNAFIRDSDRQSEMTVVRNELERNENEPGSVLDLQIYATAFREHPYHHPTIGWRSDVEGVPTSRLKEFYNTFYWPNNATLIIVGDFEEANVLGLSQKYFVPIPSSPSPIPTVYTAEPKQQGERRFLLHRAGELPIVQMAWHAVSGRDSDIYPLIVLDTILTNGVTSRLYQALIEKQLAVEVSSNAGRLYDPGLFEVAATLRPGIKPEAVEKVITEEIEWFRTNLVLQEELNRAKTLITAEFAYNGDGPAGIAEEMAEALSNGDWHIYANFTKKIENTTAEQIQDVVKKYIYKDNLTIGYFEPTEAGGENEKAETAGNLKKRDRIFKWRRPGEQRVDGTVASAADASKTVQSQPFLERIKRVKMSNGAVLLTLERRTTPTVAITGTLMAGDYLDPKDKPYLAFIVAEMLDKGTARLNKLQIARELENIGASLEFDTTVFTLAFSGRCLSRDAEKVLNLLAEQLRQPSFPTEELEKLKVQVVAQLRQSSEDTFTRAYERLTQTVYSPDSPFYRHSIDTLIKSVESITIKDVERFYKTNYGGSSLILSIVGDIDSQSIAQIAGKQFESWNGGSEKKVEVRETVLQRSGRRELVAMKDKASADIFIGHAGGLRRNSADYYAAMLANNALGQSTLSSRLGLQVRDTEGLTYDIISRFYETGFADGPWAVSVSVNPENIDKAIESSLKVVRDYIKNGINEKELEESKGSLIGSFKVSLSTSTGIATRLLEMELYNLGLNYLDRYPQLIQSLTKAQVDEAIRKYFHPDRAMVVIAGEVGGGAKKK